MILEKLEVVLESCSSIISESPETPFAGISPSLLNRLGNPVCNANSTSSLVIVRISASGGVREKKWGYRGKQINVPQYFERQCTVLFHQSGDSSSQLDHSIEPVEMYQARRVQMMYLLVDGEGNYSSYRAVRNRFRARQLQINQRIRL